MSLNDLVLVRAADSSPGPGDAGRETVIGRTGSPSLTATSVAWEVWGCDGRDGPDVLGNGLDELHCEREQAREVLLQLSAEVRRLRSASDEAVGAAKQETEKDLLELARRASACVSERDALIDRLHGQARASAAEIARLKLAAGAAVTGALSSAEACARTQYENGRLGATTLWALLMVRSLPAMPVIGLLLFFLIKTISAGDAPGAGKVYLIASSAAVVAAGLATLCGVTLQWFQLGPRWIWLRRVDVQARMLEALTSGGEGLMTSPDNLVVELSPSMSLLGLGIVRRRDNGQKYVTSEPDAWLQGPGMPRARRRLGLDLVTLVSLAAWVALLVAMYWRF